MPIIPELELLEPVNEAVRDNLHAWPIFELSDVDVTYEDEPDKQAALLGASWRTRRITGKLRPLKADQRHLLRLKGSRKSPQVELNTSTCAYRLSNDGELMIRAAGEAGLYVIQPSDEYQQVWTEMTEMVQALDLLIDYHRAAQKPSVDDVFSRLQHDLEFTKSPNVSKAATRLYSMKDFLLDCFLSGSHDIDWLSTPIYRHLAKKYPRDLKTIRKELDASEVHEEELRSLPIRTSAARLVRKRSHAMANGEPEAETVPTASIVAEPSTPKTNGVQDRRQYAMKGRSALRPSVMRRGSRRSSRLNHDLDDTDDLTDTPARMLRTAEQRDSSSASEPTPADPSSSEEESSAEEALVPRGDAQPRGVEEPAEDDEAATLIWPCSVLGCTHQIVASSLPDAQLLLDEHMSLHAYDGDMRVQLVQRLQHASLPVSHLMQRVRIQARAEDLSTR